MKVKIPNKYYKEKIKRKIIIKMLKLRKIKKRNKKH
jgi:hypothetical protein